MRRCAIGQGTSRDRRKVASIGLSTIVFCGAAVWRSPHPPTAVPPLVISVPLTSAATVDGAESPDEWRLASVNVAQDHQVLFQRDSARLFVAVRGPAKSLANLCLRVGDSAFVLHASASLGEASYTIGSDSLARLVRGFSFGNQAVAPNDFWRDHRWLGSTVRTGTSPITEFAIALSRLPARPAVSVGFASLAAPLRIAGWPSQSSTGCADRDAILGQASITLSLDPEAWAELILR
jgi:hypothetical protein